MSSGSRQLKIQILGDAKNAQEAFASVERAAGGMGEKLGNVAQIAGGFVVAKGLMQLPGLFGSTVSAGSNLEESLNAVNQIFGDSAQSILDWGENSANSFGLSQRAFNDLAVPLGAGLKNAGLSMDDVTGHTISLTERAADMASVFNTDVDEALAAIQAGLRGEADPLERFGVGLSAAAVDAEALAMTGKSVTSELTDQEKALARVNLIMKQTEDVAGDFTNTSDGAANSARIAAARQEELAATIGQKLLPVQQAITRAKLAFMEVLANRVIPAVFRLVDVIQQRLTPAFVFLRDMVGRLKDAFDSGGLMGVLRELPGVFGSIGGAILGALSGVDWGGIASGIVDGLTGAFSAAGDMTASIATWLWDAFKGINWQGIGETLVSGLLAGARAVGNFASDIATWLWDTFTAVDWANVGMAVVDGLLAGLGMVTDAGMRLYEWLRGQLTAVDWTGMGQAVVDGIMTGVAAVQDFGQRFVDWFRGGAENADWSGIGETISGQLSGALDTITDLGPVQSLIDMFNTHLLPVLQTVGDEVGSRVLPTINGFRDSLRQVAENISTNLGPTIERLRELWVQLQPAIGALLPILQTIGLVVGGVLLAAFNGFVGLMSGELPNAVNAAFAVLNGLIGIITGLVQTVTGVVQVIKGIFTGDWALAWKGAQNVVEGMVGAITSLFGGLWGALKGFIMAVVDGVIGLFQGLYNTVVGNSIIPDMINGIIEWFLKLPGEVIGIIGGWVGSVQGFFSDLQSTLTQVVSDTISAIIEFFGNLVTDGTAKAGDFVTGVIDKLIELFVDGPKRIYDFVVAGVEEIAKLAVRGAEEAGKLPGAVLDAIGDLGSTLLQTGKDLVSGLIQGIQESLPSLSDVAGGITSTITDGLGKLPGLSPSPLGIEIGQQFGDGLVVGMRDSLPKVEISAADLAAAVVQGVQNDVGRLPELLEDTGVAFAVELDKMRIAAEEALILARVRGDSEEEIAKLEADLATMRMILDAWVADTGNSIEEAHLFSLDQEQREQALADQQALLEEQKAAALDAYQRYMQDLEGIASGETATQLGQKLVDLLGMKKAAEQIGETDLAAIYEKQIKDVQRDLEIVGKIAGSAVVKGMAEEMVPEVKELSKASLKELKAIFDAAPELAEDFVDDLAQGLVDGRLELSDATELLASVPADILGQKLIDLRKMYIEQLAQAVADGNEEMADGLRELIAMLAELDVSLGKVTDSAGQAGAAVGNITQIAPGQWVSGPIGGSSGGSGGGGISSPNQNTMAGGIPIARPKDDDPEQDTDGNKPQRGYKYEFNPSTGQYELVPLSQQEIEDSATYYMPPSRSSSLQNNITVNVDGEPVAQSVNRVNTAALATNMGPV